MRFIDPVDLLSHEEVEETINCPLLEKQLTRVVATSEFYREKIERSGLSLQEASRRDRFHEWPFTTKSEILEEQVLHPPYGRLAMSRDNVVRVHMTSGTTGRPLYIAFTAFDVAANLTSGRRAFLCAGLRPEDSVVHCLNYCLWAGGLTDHMSLEGTGAAVIPFGVGHTMRLIEMIRELQPTSISCTPSYMARLEVVLKDEFGLMPRDLGLKKGFFGGEGGLQDPAVRALLEHTWGIQAIDANYGMADVLSIFGAECEHRTGLHFHGRGLLHVELIDPDSGAVLPFRSGQEGEMVLTNLIREAQPLVRYRSGDIVRIAANDRCPCGRSSFRFVVIGRADQMVVVQGINVYASAVKGLLARHHGRFGGAFEIVLESPPPIRSPLIRAERSESSSLCDDPANAVFLVNACRNELQFTPRVELVQHGGLSRTEGKTRYIRRAYEEGD
ncbi:MAG: AMP-binding protein [bacterium]